MYNTVRRHPSIALLGFLPPIWLIGIIRLWGSPLYVVTLFDFFGFGPAMSSVPWWPLALFNRLRREKKLWKKH